MTLACIICISLLGMLLAFIGGMAYYHKHIVDTLISSYAEHDMAEVDNGNTRIIIKVMKVTEDKFYEE